MNVKNAEAHAIAKELARKAGVSMTQVVIDALKARKEELTGKAEERAKVSVALARLPK